jgi:tetratricopeptide (TPR) repeat protein
MSLRGTSTIPITRFEYQFAVRSRGTIPVGTRSGWRTATWALCSACCWAAPVFLSAQENGGWIGKRVVQTRHDLALKSDERAEGRAQNEIHVYRVERIEGRLLWLEAEGAHVAGWAPAADVVAVENAVEFFTRESQARRDDPFPFLMRATVWHDKRDLAHALADYTEAIRLDPQNAALRCNRGHAYRESNEPDKAIADFDEAIRLEPTDVAAYIERGATRGSQREFDKAIADFTEAIRLAPNLAEAHTDRGVALAHENAYDKAIADFTEAIRINPADPQPYYNRGHAWASKKEFDQALADYSEAIRLNPNEVDAHINRAIIRQSRRDFDKAVAGFLRAVEISPRRVEAHLALAGAWQAMRELQKALASYEHAIELDPGSSRGHFGRAAVLFMLGRPGVGDEIKMVIAQDGWRGGLAPYAAILGHFSARRSGDPEQAKSLLESASAQADRSAWPYPIVQHLRGEIDEPKLIAAATDGDKMTEARCCLGLDQLLSGHTEAALSHFQWVKQHGEPISTEYSIAVNELERLSAKKAAPAGK